MVIVWDNEPLVAVTVKVYCCLGVTPMVVMVSVSVEDELRMTLFELKLVVGPL